MKIPLFGRGLLILYRLSIGLKDFAGPARDLVVWLAKSREVTNFTYDLEKRNRLHLAAFVSQVTRRPYQEILSYITEIESDDQLKEHVRYYTTVSKEGGVADPDVKYGGRSGWYGAVRAMKPEIVVETGVDKGLGACIITAALMKNSEEGYEGYYYGIDINPRAGYLLQGEYAEYGEILFGESTEVLKKFDRGINMFVYDGDRSAGYEATEYETIRDKLCENALILSRNSDSAGPDTLLEFAERTGRQFLFFQEKPYKHWYAKGGIGAAFGKTICS